MVGYHTINNKKTSKITKTVRIIIAAVLVLFASIQGIDFSRKNASAAAYSSEIVMEASTKRVLSASNPNARLSPASTTKAMTALVVIEKCNLDDIVTIPKAAVGVEGSSIYLKEGEKLTVKQLLYGLMLRSGNDAATALAIYAGGSTENFADMMNQKAQQMGLKNTHFTNPHGLHDEEHYTSAYDLAYISCEGMLNPTFKEIVSTKSVRIEGGNEVRYFYNKNKILSTYNGGNGVKTGYTKAAGRCLIASSLRENMQVVAVVLNRPDMFERCAYLMDFAHNNYHMQKVTDESAVAARIPVTKGKVGQAELRFAQDMYFPIKKDGSEAIECVFRLPNSIKAPYKKAAYVGDADFFLDNHLLFSQKLYTINNVEKKSFLDSLKEKLR
ncbi:MAG: D-alanyl-D-alanine carboxypeptidase family protein [Clostridia bacterium]